MNFGQNLYNWILVNAQHMVMAAIVIGIVWFSMKREFSKLIGMIVVFMIAVGFVYNPMGVKNILLNLFNMITGGS